MTTPSPLELLPELLQLAIDAARSAAEGILSGFRSERLRAEKISDGTPVTQFDREAEEQIRAYLSRHQPQPWPVLGEELGDDSQGARYRWVIDPIDGTRSYARGIPLFGTLLAFEDVIEKRSLLGVVHLPAMNETYSAARGHGAWCNGERIQVASSRPLRDCLISAPPEHYFRLAGIAESEAQLRAQAPQLRCYVDCWAHGMAARGSLDAVVEFRLARWDIAASEVLVEEAGGRVLIWDAPHAPGKYDWIVGSPSAVAEVSAIIRGGTSR
jgi:histidinol phosphatase-like enzyme (inositol monophosphatase family)